MEFESKLDKAKELAQISVCMTTLRGIGTGIFMYASENEDYPTQARYETGQTWSGRLKEQEYATFFQCPAHKKIYRGIHDEDGWDLELRSYTINGYTTMPTGTWDEHEKLYRISEIPYPAGTGLAAELWRNNHWSEGVVENTVHNDLMDSINCIMWYWNISHAGENIGFHGEDYNQSVLFYDGHVDSYPFEIWTGSDLTWAVYGWRWEYFTLNY